MTSRILPFEEWHRLPEYMDPVLMEAKPSQSRMCVVEDDHGQIIGRSMLYPILCAEDVWIDPAYRGSPIVARPLWRLMHTAAHDLGFRHMMSTPTTAIARQILEHPSVKSDPFPSLPIAFPVQEVKYG